MNFEEHPCFNDKNRHLFGRIHLPVAPKCNIQCNYCVRKFDCVNESRPGVTSTVLTPKQALKYLDKIIEKSPNIKVMGIAGPGDPFANPDETMETLRLVRDKYPDMMLCIASNGLNLPPYIEELARLKVSHVTVTLNAVDPEITAKVYAWVRDNKKIYRGIEGATLLLERQLESIKLLKKHGIMVKVNTILMPTINETHITEVARKMKELGVDILNIMPLYPTKESVFENLPQADHDLLKQIREEAGKYIPQMHHCTRCRADAVGLIGEEMTKDDFKILNDVMNDNLKPTENRPFVAVATMEGVLINQHLGEAASVHIYANKAGKPHFLEKRKTPPAGLGDQRWNGLSEVLNDCYAILAAGAGENPKKILSGNGLNVVMAEGIIDEVLEDFFAGNEVKFYQKSKKSSCGECTGAGTGCG